MSTDLQRFLRAVRTLAELEFKYDLKNHLDTLDRYATAKQKLDISFASALLDSISQALLKRRLEHARRCHQCGGDIDNVMLGTTVVPIARRADAQYCSPDCRQRAYRNRVTANTPKRMRKHNGKDIPLRLKPRTPPKAITQTAPSEAAKAR